MIKRGKGGRIINISSVMGKKGYGNGNTAYCASKFGVIGLTQSLALELAPHHILVNAVCPTIVDTDITIDHVKEQAQLEGISVEESRERLFKWRTASIPLGRVASTEDVANMVAFLASDEADFITGQYINVTGGELMAP